MVKKRKKKIDIKQLVVISFFSIIAFIYFHNITQDIYSGDIGDLVTSSYFMGVAHPPGYPLFTFLGFLFSHLPLPLSIVTKVALISTIASFTALIIYYRFSLFATKNIFISLLSTSILAFSYLFWLHAEIPEAFGLNNLFVVILITCSFFFYKTKKIAYLYTLSFSVGLSLTHHHTILLLFPLVGLLLLKNFKIVFLNKKNLLVSIVLFILGLSFYLYVPIAASRQPLINWDNATTVNSFIHLLLRKDYGGFAPRIDNEIPVAIKLIVAGDYIKTIISIFSYQILFIALLGFFYLIKKDKYFLFTLCIAYIISGPFFVYYAATLITTTTALGIIERFYVMSTIVFMFFVPFGFLFLKQFIENKFSKKIYSYFSIGYFIIVPLLLIQYNFPKTDLSNSTFGIQLSKDIFSYIPNRGILYISGDTTTFNTWYVHYVLQERPDIGLINPAGVGGNKFLTDEINKFHENNKKIRLPDILHMTMEELRKERTVFATYEMDYEPPDSLLVPRGMVFELVKKNDIPKEKEYIEKVDKSLKKLHITTKDKLLPNQRNLVAAEIPMIYSNAHVRIGDFMTTYYKNTKVAQKYYKKAIEIDYENPSGYAGLGLSMYKADQNCKGAIDNMEKAISYYPIWKTYYSQLYVLHNKCKSDKKTLNAFKTHYESTFNKSIEKDLLPNYQKELDNKPI